MIWDSNLIEETVKLANDCRNLRRQVAGIHDDKDKGNSTLRV